MTGRCVWAAVLWAAVAQPAWSQSAGSETTALRDLRERATTATVDPSSRTRLVVPSIDFSAEIGKDKKSATAKAGFDLSPSLTGGFGVTGAFDESEDRSVLTSLRSLSPGSSVWASLTWKRYRVKALLKRQEQICRQAAWAEGKGLFDFKCRQSELPTTSFAEELAVKADDSNVGEVCDRFVYAIMTPGQFLSGTPVGIDCRATDDVILASVRDHAARGAIIDRSFADRAAVARGPAEQLAVCNDFRRTRGEPPVAECDISKFAKDEEWTLSWDAQFKAATPGAPSNAQAIAVCEKYERASGKVPTGSAACAPANPEELFDISFRERYATSYRWLGTPILSVRFEADRTSFNYLDAALAKQTETHAGHAWTATVGLLTAGDTLFALNYADARGWKAKPKTSLCRPVADTDATACADAVLGPPEARIHRQIEGEIKRRLTKSVGGALYVTRDMELDAWGVEVPFYFLKDGNGGWSGGIVASYRSDEKRYDVAVFVGQVFDLFK